MAWANPKVIPASCAHLEFRELEAALIWAEGNVTATAKALGVPPPDLRRFVYSTKLSLRLSTKRSKRCLTMRSRSCATRSGAPT